MFSPITDVSPIDILKIVASSMTTATQIAAREVSCGLIRSNEGSIKPRLPMSSDKPINLTGIEFISFVHGISSFKFSMGSNNFIAPVEKKTKAKNICAAQSTMFRTLDEF